MSAKSKDQLKKELLNDVKQNIKLSNDPQKQALKLAENAHQAQNKFEKAIKKPYSEFDQTATFKKQSIQQKQNEKIEPKPSEIKSGNNKEFLSEQSEQISVSKEKQFINIQIQKEKKTFLFHLMKNLKLRINNRKVKKNPKKKKNKPLPEEKQTFTMKQSDTDNKQQLFEMRETQQKSQRTEEKSKSESPAHDKSHHHHHHCKHNHSHRHHSQSSHRYEEQEESLIQVQQQKKLEIEIRKYQIENQSLKTELEVFVKENLKLRNQIATSNENYEKYEKNIMEQLEKIKIENLQLKEQLQDQKFKIVELEHQYNFAQKETKQLENQQTLTLTNQDKYIQEIAQLRQINENQSKQLFQKNSEYERVQSELQIVNNDLISLKTQSQILVAEKRDQTNQIQQLKIENEKLNGQVSIHEENHNDKLSGLTRKINKLNEQLVAAQADNEHLIKNMDSYIHERDHYKNEFDQLKLNLIELEELRKRYKLKEIEVEQLQIDNDKLKWKVRKDPNGILSDLKIMTIKQEEPQILKPNKENQMLKEIQNQDREIRTLREQNYRLQSENKSFIDQLHEANNYIDELKQMFNRERQYLEDRLDQEVKQKRIPENKIQSNEQGSLQKKQQKPEQHVRFSPVKTTPYQMPALYSNIPSSYY